MPLSPTLPLQEISGQQQGRDLTLASVMLFCCRTRGWLRTLPVRRAQSSSIYIQTSGCRRKGSVS